MSADTSNRGFPDRRRIETIGVDEAGIRTTTGSAPKARWRAPYELLTPNQTWVRQQHLGRR